jgi:cell division septal protein FtsQ
MENGKVFTPPNQIPQPFPELTGEQAENPQVKHAFEVMAKMRDEFIADM